MKIRVSENPNRIEVERNGLTHSARWHGKDIDENLSGVIGDESLCRAALLAWTGQNEQFELTDQELTYLSGGRWRILT